MKGRLGRREGTWEILVPQRLDVLINRTASHIFTLSLGDEGNPYGHHYQHGWK
jgi:hypothetical protein